MVFKSDRQRKAVMAKLVGTTKSSVNPEIIQKIKFKENPKAAEIRQDLKGQGLEITEKGEKSLRRAFPPVKTVVVGGITVINKPFRRQGIIFKKVAGNTTGSFNRRLVDISAVSKDNAIIRNVGSTIKRVVSRKNLTFV